MFVKKKSQQQREKERERESKSEKRSKNNKTSSKTKQQQQTYHLLYSIYNISSCMRLLQNFFILCEDFYFLLL